MKNKKGKLGLVAALSSLTALLGCQTQSTKQIATNNSNSDTIREEKPFINTTSDSLRLEKRLLKLSKTKYNGRPGRGAMCYVPLEPKLVDYVCSHCGNTISDKYENITVSTIKSIEYIVNQIKSLGYDVVLDKTEYCPHCSQREIERPELIFKIRFSENSDYHVVYSNIVDSYRCLYEFLTNGDTYEGRYGTEHLCNKISTIQNMTGLGKDLR